jgi:probable rRNA maturation factor
VTALEHGVPETSAEKLGAWLARSAPSTARGDVVVVLVPDAEMRRLNRRFRGVSKVTDVLSFPSGHANERRRMNHQRRMFLGEIVIAKGLAARQARNYGHRLSTELRILALHGLLHLLGYDHDVDNGRMARVEARLRRRAGLPDGLIARTS